MDGKARKYYKNKVNSKDVKCDFMDDDSGLPFHNSTNKLLLSSFLSQECNLLTPLFLEEIKQII